MGIVENDKTAPAWTWVYEQRDPPTQSRWVSYNYCRTDGFESLCAIHERPLNECDAMKKVNHG
jgi:hypothetical protein